jgi:LPS-assembly lipoprotein
MLETPFRVMRLPVLLLPLLLGAVSGCGFEPLYGDQRGGSVMGPLAEVEIAPIQERVGQEIRNRLIDRMRSPSRAPAVKYRLLVSTNSNRADYGVAKETAPTFSSVSLVARYSLLDASSGVLLTNNAAIAIVNFSSTTSPFSTIVGDDDARRRAAEQVADTIVNQLAVYFQNRQRGETEAPLAPPPILEPPFLSTPIPR